MEELRVQIEGTPPEASWVPAAAEGSSPTVTTARLPAARTVLGLSQHMMSVTCECPYTRIGLDTLRTIDVAAAANARIAPTSYRVTRVPRLSHPAPHVHTSPELNLLDAAVDPMLPCVSASNSTRQDP